MQMEDEIASMCSVIGPSWAGAKTMPATSGPGISLIKEAIGLCDFLSTTRRILVDTSREDIEQFQDLIGRNLGHWPE